MISCLASIMEFSIPFVHVKNLTNRCDCHHWHNNIIHLFMLCPIVACRRQGGRGRLPEEGRQPVSKVDSQCCCRARTHLKAGSRSCAACCQLHNSLCLAARCTEAPGCIGAHDGRDARDAAVGVGTRRSPPTPGGATRRELPPAVAGPSSPPGLGAVATTTRPTAAPAATSAATTGGETALAPPWPTADALTGTVRIITDTMGERTSNFASASLPIHAHVSARIRAKIWAREFVDLATLLLDRERKTHDCNSYELSLIPAREGAPPAMQVSEKPMQNSGSFQRWLKAFETYMLIMLLQPHCVADAPKILQYINSVRNLYERGGNWVLYDETFRSMRVSEGWQWDIVHWELWLNAQPVSGRLPSAPAPSFIGKGKRPQRADKICYAFNGGVQCRQPCAYSHKCRRCGAAHPFTKCVAGNKRTTSAAARSDRK